MLVVRRVFQSVVLLLFALVLGSCQDSVPAPTVPERQLDVTSERSGSFVKPLGGSALRAPEGGVLDPYGEAAVLSHLTSGLAVETLSPSLTAADLAQSLAGPGIVISNVTYTGAAVAAGRFQGGSGIIGIESGVILSTGHAGSVVGPNEANGHTTAHGTAGDSDLDALVNPNATNDAAVLEFDFVPNGTDVAFEFVFGSEEYNEYVGTQFNDVFAFFVNGVNCAQVNGGPVSVNNVNGDSNSAFYRNNDLASGAPINTEMDGLTVVLVCQATVDAGVVNTMKLAIADAGDSSLDSNVLIRAGSFSTTLPGQIGVSPLTATVAEGGSHTVVATVRESNEAPRAGETVSFSIVSGPDAGAAGTGTTDALGQATFTFTNTGGPGTDVVQASFTDAVDGALKTGTAEVVWTPVRGTLAGTVTDSETAALLAGATVTVLQNGTAVASDDTDANGQYQIGNLVPGSYDLTVALAGYHPGSATGLDVQADQTTAADVPLAIIKGTLAGTILVLGTGDPLAGASVSVTPVTGGAPVVASTDGNGAYAIDLRPGDYGVTAAAPGFQQQESATAITAGQTAPLDFALGVAFSITAHDPNGGPAVNVVATMTRITEPVDFFVVCTDANGVATFELPGGDYLAHIRNLSEANGKLCDPAELSIWPDQGDEFFDVSAAADRNWVGVLYDADVAGTPGAPDLSLVLNPGNYVNTALNPRLTLGDPSAQAPSAIGLQFRTGAIIACNLVDSNGDPVTLTQNENVDFILPFDENGSGVNFDNPLGLPRGIGNLMAALFAGGDGGDGSQSVAGATAGLYVCETTPVLVNNEPVVYRDVVEVTEGDEASGNTVTVDAEPEPIRARTDYLLDPWGDHTAQSDIGLVTYGWGEAGGVATDEFILATRMRSTATQGAFTLVLEVYDVAGSLLVRSRASCREHPTQGNRCITNTGDPTTVEIVGSSDGSLGQATVVWRVPLPGVSELDFRLESRGMGATSPVSDIAPNVGVTVRATKTSGSNSFMIKGE